MTKRLVRLHVTRVTRCMFCPSRFPKTMSPTVCGEYHCGALPWRDGELGYEYIERSKVDTGDAPPTWCPLRGAL